jgi:hypothetical protein
MSDFDFEARLERLFAQPPHVQDPIAFARRIEARLDREWTLRRLAIGAAGLAGAVIMLSQTLGSQVFARLETFAGPTRRLAAEQWQVVTGESLLTQPGLLSGEVLWTLAAVGGLIAAFAATRWAEAL